MTTITLKDIEFTFAEALQYMLDGKCLGIKPGTNSNYIVLYKPHWMNEESSDYMLKWNGREENATIRTNQFLGIWHPVIINHKTLKNGNNKL